MSPTNYKDESGNRFSKLLVLERADKIGAYAGAARWLCKCDCGIECIKHGYSLRSGIAKNCGNCVSRKSHPRKLSVEEKERRKTEPRQCSKCLIVQPATSFYPDQPTWHWCKSCRATWGKNRPKIPHLWLKKRYDITYEEYQEKLASQDSKCCICLTPWTKEEPLNVDHDHRLAAKDRNSHRGLLCKRCNTALGALRDNVENLQRAIEYLTLHNKRLDKLL